MIQRAREGKEIHVSLSQVGVYLSVVRSDCKSGSLVSWLQWLGI